MDGKEGKGKRKRRGGEEKGDKDEEITRRNVSASEANPVFFFEYFLLITIQFPSRCNVYSADYHLSANAS